MKVAIAQINPVVGDLKGNLDKIISYIREANEKGDAELIVFPECALTGYPLEDLTLHTSFVKSVEECNTVLENTISPIPFVVGTIRMSDADGETPPYNAALIAVNTGVHKRIQYTAKVELPNYDVFDEKRVFTRAEYPNGLFTYFGKTIAVMICEDMWHARVADELVRQNTLVNGNKPIDLFVVINGSPYESGKVETRLDVAKELTNKHRVPLLYVNLVGGQDEIVFDGASFILGVRPDIDEYTFRLVRVSPMFKEELTYVNVHENKRNQVTTDTPQCWSLNHIKNDYNAIVLGLRDYVNKVGAFNGVVIGNSGGIDSALTLTMAVDALGPGRVKSVMMPFDYTSEDSLLLSKELAENLGIDYEVVPIKPIVDGLEQSLGGFGFPFDFSGLAHQNSQSRARALVLMTYSNRYGYMVLTTGNKSEVSAGYATLYGDMVGGMNALKDVYKTDVFAMAKWRNEEKVVIPEEIINRPPSAELAPDQKDEDDLPPYEILDAIMRCIIDKDMGVEETAKLLKLDEEIVKNVRIKLDRNEFKRRQACHGVKVTERNFGRGRRWPIVNKWGEQ